MSAQGSPSMFEWFPTEKDQTLNPLLRGGDELDIMIDAAKREIRSQFMQHWRVIKRWEPAPCPPRVLVAVGRTPYLDEIELPRKGWFRS